MLGIEDKSCTSEDDEDCLIEVSVEDDLSDIDQKTGVERFGSTSLIDNIGAMLLIAGAILIVLVLLCILKCCTKRSKCTKKIYDLIKKKLFYNAFLRYVLQSTLKLQIAACTILFYT